MPACAAPKNFLSKAMKKVDLYTDGACSGNPGAGGYGAILIYRGLEKEISGGEPSTTNNRMEIRAVIEATHVAEEKDSYKGKSPLELTKKELRDYIRELEDEMKQAASDLQFERAAQLRDKIFEYKVKL